MFNWGAFTLYLYILMRISGFVLFSPIFARRGISATFQAGFIMVLTGITYSVYGGTAEVPATLLEFALHLLLELAMGIAVSFVMRFFFYIADQAGEIIDSQMGLSMARMYDASSDSQTTVTANLLNTLMLLLFFAENGHLTLLHILLDSGSAVPFGSAAPGAALAEKMVVLFADCVVLAVKLAFPILGAELLGQIGMGVLMKAIPQINIFSINIELKMIIGLVMLLVLISPMSTLLLEYEQAMLTEIRSLFAAMGG